MLQQFLYKTFEFISRATLVVTNCNLQCETEFQNCCSCSRQEKYERKSEISDMKGNRWSVAFNRATCLFT